MAGSKLDRDWFARGTLTVARELLGTVLVRKVRGRRLAGRIVETEAYMGPDDVASHSRYGPESKAAPMFGEPGHAYIYFTYGMHHCMNVVTEPPGSGTAVLIRALEPLEGIEQMRANRGQLSADRLRELTNGPAKLCQALGLDRSLNRTDLLGDTLWIETGEPVAKPSIAASPRVGISRGREHHWRFYVADSPFISAHPKY